MRLLLIEDEPRLLRTLARALQEEGYAVDTAEDGEDGLYKAVTFEYDSVVLDVMLPKLDGWGVLEKLRRVKSTPVLMLTTESQGSKMQEGKEAGATGWIVKPFEPDKLLAVVKKLVG